METKEIDPDADYTDEFPVMHPDLAREHVENTNTPIFFRDLLTGKLAHFAPTEETDPRDILDGLYPKHPDA